MTDEFGVGITTDMSFEQAIMRTRLVMMAKGFSILSEMPAPPILGEGAGRQHLFLGIWSRMVSTENLGGQGLDVGDHLACNVVVFESEAKTSVAILDPTEGLEGWTDKSLAEEAQQAFLELLEEIGSTQD